MSRLGIVTSRDVFAGIDARDLSAERIACSNSKQVALRPPAPEDTACGLHQSSVTRKGASSAAGRLATEIATH